MIDRRLARGSDSWEKERIVARSEIDLSWLKWGAKKFNACSVVALRMDPVRGRVGPLIGRDSREEMRWQT